MLSRRSGVGAQRLFCDSLAGSAGWCAGGAAAAGDHLDNCWAVTNDKKTRFHNPGWVGGGRDGVFVRTLFASGGASA